MSDGPTVRRGTGNLDAQRAVARALIGGSLAFVLAMFGVVWAVAVPHGPYAPRRFAPVLTAAVRRAAMGDAITLRGLYSREGLRASTIEDVEAWLDRTDAFVGADGVVIRAVERTAGTDATAPLSAVVAADITYVDQLPPRGLTATLDYEEDEWRIRSLTITPLAETP